MNIKAVRGQCMSCGTNLGKIYIRSGTYVARNETAWQRRSVSADDYTYVPEMEKQNREKC